MQEYSPQTIKIYFFIGKSDNHLIPLNIEDPETSLFLLKEHEDLIKDAQGWLAKNDFPYYNFERTEKENILDFVEEKGWVLPYETKDVRFEIPF